MELEEVVELLHLDKPVLRPTVNKLGEDNPGIGAELKNLLSHEVAPTALAGDLRQRLGAVLGMDRRWVGLITTRMFRLKAASDDA